MVKTFHGTAEQAQRAVLFAQSSLTPPPSPSSMGVSHVPNMELYLTRQFITLQAWLARLCLR